MLQIISKILVPKSLSWRLSTTFSFLLVLFVGVEIPYLYYSMLRSEHEQLQLQNWTLATDISQQLAGVLASAKPLNAESENLSVELSRFTVLNRQIDLYLIRNDGYVLAASNGQVGWPADKEVNAYKKLLSLEPPEELPHYISHPVFPGGKKRFTPFSLAEVMIGDTPGYLLVCLESIDSRRYRQALRNWNVVWRGVLIIIGIAAAMTVMGAYLFLLITRQFRVFTGAVNKIANGDYTISVPVKGTDEVSALGQQINKMSTTIREQLETIERGDLARRRLMGAISTELIEPVSMIRQNLQTLTKDFPTRCPAGEAINTLEASRTDVGLLAERIKLLFELSKIEAGEREPKFEIFSIADLVSEEIVFGYKSKAEAQSLDFSADIEEELDLVLGDAQVIHGALSNIVDYFIRYGNPGGRLGIMLGRQLDRISVTVEGTAEVTEGSNGLHLEIARKLLELHGELLQINATANMGLAFHFSLPVASYSS